MNREKVLADIAHVADVVAKLESAVEELQQDEHSVTLAIESASPQDSIAARMKRQAILEATADAAARLEKARERLAARERDLKVHDAQEECSKLVAEYNDLLTGLHTELAKHCPTIMRMNEIAKERAWLEKAVIRVNGDMTQSYFLRPTGAVAFGKDWVRVIERRYDEFPEGIQD